MVVWRTHDQPSWAKLSVVDNRFAHVAKVGVVLIIATSPIFGLYAIFAVEASDVIAAIDLLVRGGAHWAAVDSLSQKLFSLVVFFLALLAELCFSSKQSLLFLLLLFVLLNAEHLRSPDQF
jgi:hypothetical protein